MPMVDNWSAYQKAFFSGALDDRYGWYVAYSDGRLIDAAQTRAMLRERLRTHPEERFMIIEVGQKHPTALETIRTLQRADVFSVLRRFIITCGYLFGILLILIKAPLIALLAAALGPHIAYLHGKDRKVNDRMGRVVGDGDIDWPLFMRLYHEHADEKPIILEYVTKDNVVMARDRLLEADRASRA